MNKLRKFYKGFTFIELLVIIVILGILILLALPRFKGHIENAHLAHIKNDVKVAEGIATPELFENNNEWPKYWEPVDKDWLVLIAERNALYETKGLVDGEIEDDEYARMTKESFTTKLKGDFYVNKGGKAYYVNNADKIAIMSHEMRVELNNDNEYNVVVNLDNLAKIKSITADNGLITHEVINEELEINIANMSISETIFNSIKHDKEVSSVITNLSDNFDESISFNEEKFEGELIKDGKSTIKSGVFTPAENKEVIETRISQGTNTTPTNVSYNQDGFIGTLNRSRTDENVVQTGGVYTPAESKQITGHTSANYNSGGFTGTLTQYVESGSPATPTTKYVTNQSRAAYNSEGYTGTLTQYVESGRLFPPETRSFQVEGASYYTYNGYGAFSTTYYYYQNGFTGYLPYSHSRHLINDLYVPVYRGSLTKPGADTRVYRYQGNVTHPGTDTRVYKYQGNVTHPGTDTRVYKYKGTVNKPASDTRTYRTDYTSTYKGTVNKPSSDTRVWEQLYKGTVYKGGNDDIYRSNVKIEYYKNK
ncbi:MAG TPA: hypothetical protein GXZ90_08980 [Clostridiales bacterium]|nr:hypothetical protein [Clostridiales bacterium]